MFAPEFRTTEVCNFIAPLQTFVTFNYGESMWTDLANDMQTINQNRMNF